MASQAPLLNQTAGIAPGLSESLPQGFVWARRWAMLLLGGALLVVCALTGHYLLNADARRQSAAGWMRCLDLSMPALWPSGTLLRAPESASAAVDLRLTPAGPDLDRHAAVVRIQRMTLPRKDLP